LIDVVPRCGVVILDSVFTSSNSQTGATMSMPAKKVVKFKAGTKLTDMVK